MSFRNKYLRCVFLKTETHCCSCLTNLTESQEIITVLAREIYLELAGGGGLIILMPSLSPDSAPQTRVQAKLLIIQSLGSHPNIINSQLWDNDTTSFNLHRPDTELSEATLLHDMSNEYQEGVFVRLSFNTFWLRFVFYGRRPDILSVGYQDLTMPWIQMTWDPPMSQRLQIQRNDLCCCLCALCVLR